MAYPTVSPPGHNITLIPAVGGQFDLLRANLKNILLVLSISLNDAEELKRLRQLAVMTAFLITYIAVA